MSWISFGPCGGWGHADACPAVHKTGDGMESMVLPGTGPELKPRKLVTLSVNARDQNSFVPSSGAKAKLELDNGMSKSNQQMSMYCIGWHTWFQFFCKFCYTLKLQVSIQVSSAHDGKQQSNHQVIQWQLNGLGQPIKS